MDIFDIDGDTGDGVRLLKTALPAVVPDLRRRVSDLR
jgi:hypothetical protein